MDALTKITSDVLDIAARLKEIDPRYEVYRNLSKHRFEIHADGALQIAVPFTRLDERTLSLVRETGVERAEELLNRLERDNVRREKAKLSEAKDRIMASVEDAL